MSHPETNQREQDLGPFPVWLTRVEFVIASLLMRGSFDGIDQTPLH